MSINKLIEIRLVEEVGASPRSSHQEDVASLPSACSLAPTPAHTVVCYTVDAVAPVPSSQVEVVTWSSSSSGTLPVYRTIPTTLWQMKYHVPPFRLYSVLALTPCSSMEVAWCPEGEEVVLPT